MVRVAEGTWRVRVSLREILQTRTFLDRRAQTLFERTPELLQVLSGGGALGGLF